MEQDIDVDYIEGDLGTLILHGLADDIGCEAADLRHALGISVASAMSRPTNDETTLWVLSSDGTTAADVLELDVQGAAANADEATVRVKSTQDGMYIVNDEGYCGVTIAINGAGADDDAIVKAKISGILPDSQDQVISLASGVNHYQLPKMRAVDATFTITFENVSKTSKVGILLTSVSKRAKSDVARAGRVALAERGIPVGSAMRSLLGTMNAVAKAREVAKGQYQAQMLQALRRGDAGGVGRLRMESDEAADLAGQGAASRPRRNRSQGGGSRDRGRGPLNKGGFLGTGWNPFKRRDRR